ncbi:MAG: hypothetical protein KAH22_00765 [Thiotrichaceae bacterium]|nr:hypothetical protein [Thiotrichaceae bacterium]
MNSAYAEKAEFNLPVSKSYRHYVLQLNVVNRRPEVEEAIILEADLTPNIAGEKVSYQFYINGRSIGEGGTHRVHSFEDTGTYKITALAKIGSFLLNSPPVIIHVIDAWKEPEAVIEPQVLTVKQGEPAQFQSLSETASQSRQWLYWSLSTGHKSNKDQFTIDTARLSPGRYPVQLLVKDDRQREAVARAILTIKSKSGKLPGPVVMIEEGDSPEDTDPSKNMIELKIRSSHQHQLNQMAVVFWLQNTQYGADTELQFDPGDGASYRWDKKIRYSHRYQQSGFYHAVIRSRSPSGKAESNAVLVIIWPRWLPLVLILLGLLLAILPFYHHYKRQQLAQFIAAQETGFYYQQHSVSGQHQITFYSPEQLEVLSIDESEEEIEKETDQLEENRVKEKEPIKSEHIISKDEKSGES